MPGEHRVLGAEIAVRRDVHDAAVAPARAQHLLGRVCADEETRIGQRRGNRSRFRFDQRRLFVGDAEDERALPAAVRLLLTRA